MWKKTGGERGRPRGDWRMEPRSAAPEAGDTPRIYRRRESDPDVPVSLSPPAVGSSGFEWGVGVGPKGEVRSVGGAEGEMAGCWISWFSHGRSGAALKPVHGGTGSQSPDTVPHHKSRRGRSLRALTMGKICVWCFSWVYRTLFQSVDGKFPISPPPCRHSWCIKM